MHGDAETASPLPYHIPVFFDPFRQGHAGARPGAPADFADPLAAALYSATRMVTGKRWPERYSPFDE